MFVTLTISAFENPTTSRNRAKPPKFFTNPSLRISSVKYTSINARDPIGTYVEANVGTNLYAIGIFTSDSPAGTAGINGYAWNAAIGYNLRSWFGLEGGFTRSSIKVHSHDHHYN
jgi:hypothetical protein